MLLKWFVSLWQIKANEISGSVFLMHIPVYNAESLLSYPAGETLPCFVYSQSIVIKAYMQDSDKQNSSQFSERNFPFYEGANKAQTLHRPKVFFGFSDWHRLNTFFSKPNLLSLS